jgi:Family of unknown function (DUF6326)
MTSPGADAPTATTRSRSWDPPQAPRPRRVGQRQVVASLWLFAILNYLYCDVLSMHESAYLQGLLTGTVGGIEFTQAFLLLAGMLMTVPIGAVLISRIAPHLVARWVSVAAGVFMTVVQVGSLTVGSAPTPLYIYFSIIEISTTAFIAWYALTRWKVDVQLVD